MRFAHIIPTLAALTAGILLSVLAAAFAVNVVENRSQGDVRRVLELNGYDWAEVDVDGLQIVLGGFAPDEATRFRALGIAGTVVDASRVVDMMNVTVQGPIRPPHFSIEILRNDDGISLIGLVPAEMDRETVVDAIGEIAGGANVTDLLKAADYPAPEGWESALGYGLYALASLPRSKISISSERVELKAISDSIAQKRKLETDLALKAPKGLRVAIDITAPRPVITPYTLRFLIDAEGPRFDACSTDSDAGRDLILAAARAVGMEGKATCKIGLGIPSPTWDEAVVTGINGLAALGGGSITFSDADITLVALDSTEQAVFDQQIGELEAKLPDAFSLHAVLPEPVKIDGTGEADTQGPPEFVATLSPEGLVQLRGRILDRRTRTATENYARAQFGSSVVNGTMRLDPDLPAGWSTRVLVSLQSLAMLHNGTVITQPDFVEIRGVTGNQDARAEIARILSQKLGKSENYRISIVYEEKFDPLADIPTPEECVERIGQVLSIRQITFAPSSADIVDEARESIENIVEIMKKCTDVPMEVGGHTDSQGREVMNQSLSQSRAEAVVTALMARRVLTSNLTAVGYGESVPIEDNKTQAGREANRRIEFKLILPEAETPPEEAGDAVEEADAAAESDTPNTEVPDEQN
ncbi:MAG: OmpA family protein [Paracoccaceae bacterium]